MDKLDKNNPATPNHDNFSATEPAKPAIDNEKAASETMSTSTTLSIPALEPAPRKALPRTKHLNLLGAGSIAFYINNLEEPLVVHFSQQISLGRRSDSTGVQPSLDLTPYNG